MSAQYTSGPWTTDGSARAGDLDIIAPSGRVALIDCEPRGDFQSEAVLESNARLISAAPDLLAALRIAEDALDMYSGGQSSDLAAIRAAIDKAMGAE